MNSADPIPGLLERARVHWVAREHPQAEGFCRQVLALQPANSKALQMLADLAVRGGRPDVSVQLLRQAAEVEPDNADILVSLGIAQMSLDQPDQAISAFERAIALAPDSLAAHNNLSVALKTAGREAESIDVLRRVVQLRPADADAHAVLANAITAAGRSRDALESFRRAIELAPTVAATHANYGKALYSSGQVNEAIESCRRGIELGAPGPEPFAQLGIALNACGRCAEAVVAYQRAIAINPKYVGAWTNMGIALRTLQRMDEAIAAYRKSIEILPDNPEAYNVLGNALCDRGRRREAIEAYRHALDLRPDFVAAHDNLVYTLLFNPDETQETIYEENCRWNAEHALPLAQPDRVHENSRDAERILRVGYVSGDFRKHVVSFNILPLFLNRDPGQLHVTCYSNVRVPDATTEQFRARSDEWRDIVGVSDAEVAEQVVADKIDILVDLALHSSGGRLLIFARKPAPVQATFAGYPGTTGMTAIDYRLTDPHLDPPGLNDAYYSEESIRLPDSFWVYCPMTDQPAVGELPAMKNGFVTFGCLGNFSKLNEVSLGWWSRVLRSVPNSRMLILAPQGIQRQETLGAIGLPPERVEFIEFQPRLKYLETYHRIDIGLDTFPYNGHTTSLDALWMGVPVVSLYGQPAVSRAGLSQATNLGLTELTADDAEGCVKIATSLANDLPRLAEMRRGLRQRMARSPLMDDKRFTRNIEAAYRAMWRRWRGGEQRSALD